VLLDESASFAFSVSCGIHQLDMIGTVVTPAAIFATPAILVLGNAADKNAVAVE